MLGNMMTEPLLISGILEHAIQNNSKTEIVSKRVEGDIHRYSILDAAKRSKQLANALVNLGVKEGDVLGKWLSMVTDILNFILESLGLEQYCIL